LAGLLVTTVLVAAGCVTMTADARLRNEIFWDAARECEGRYRTLHLDQIDTGGNITMHADAESRSELRPFTECYRQAVRRRIEERRQAGLPIPETLEKEPTVELD
jgi:hypothetical protein